jgi:hypothetical protein
MPIRTPIYIDGIVAGHSELNVQRSRQVVQNDKSETKGNSTDSVIPSPRPDPRKVPAVNEETKLTRQLSAIAAIGQSETDLSRKEAFSDFYNNPKKSSKGYNANVAKQGEHGADYGFFQMNQGDVKDAIKLGDKGKPADQAYKETISDFIGDSGKSDSHVYHDAVPPSPPELSFPITGDYPKNIDAFVKKFGRIPATPDEKAFYTGQTPSRGEEDLVAEALDEKRSPAQKEALKNAIITAKHTASELNFPPERVTASDIPYSFMVGGVEHQVGGEYSSKTGIVTIYPGGLSVEPHEIEHAKYDYWRKGGGRISEADMQRMEKSWPGVTPYASENWKDYQEVKKNPPHGDVVNFRDTPKETRDRAINETLAEIALNKYKNEALRRFKMSPSKAEEIYKSKYSPEWEKLYESVDRAWKNRPDLEATE